MADLHGSLAEAAGGDVRGYLADMLRETDFKHAIRTCAPDLLDEVEGVAEGASLASDDVYALQLLDEEWAFRVGRASARELSKCSSLAIAEPGGPTWIGQNMDLGDYTDGHQVLLELEADGAAPAARVFSTAGMIGLMGVNAAGVGVCVNSLSQLPNAAEGLPVAFVLRRLLQTRELQEALGPGAGAAPCHQPAPARHRDARRRALRSEAFGTVAVHRISAGGPGPRLPHQPPAHRCADEPRCGRSVGELRGAARLGDRPARQGSAGAG